MRAIIGKVHNIEKFERLVNRSGSNGNQSSVEWRHHFELRKRSYEFRWGSPVHMAEGQVICIAAGALFNKNKVHAILNRENEAYSGPKWFWITFFGVLLIAGGIAVFAALPTARVFVLQPLTIARGYPVFLALPIVYGILGVKLLYMGIKNFKMKKMLKNEPYEEAAEDDKSPELAGGENLK
jgi:hypothetical protein